MGGWFLFITQLGGGSSAVSPPAENGGGAWYPRVRVDRTPRVKRHDGLAEYALYADSWIQLTESIKTKGVAHPAGPQSFVHVCNIFLTHELSFSASKLKPTPIQQIKMANVLRPDLAAIFAATPAERQYDELMAILLASFALNDE